MTKFSYVWWILISKGQRVQDIPISALISDFSKDLRQPRCQRRIQKRHFNQDLKKNNVWSFIILSLTSATAKVNAKKNPKQEVARCNYETETWWVTLKWQKHTLLNEKKGVRHSLLWNLAKAQYLPLLRSKKRKEENSGYINASAKKDTQNKDKWIFIQK